MHLNVIPKARNESSKASTDTLKKRVNLIEKDRKVTAGKHDTGIQQAAEIAKLPIDRRAEVACIFCCIMLMYYNNVILRVE